MARLIYLASTFYLMQSIGAIGIVDRLLYGEWAGKGGNKVSLLFNLLQIVVSSWLVSRDFRRVRSIGAGPIIAAALVGFMFLSSAWSVDPQTTIRRSTSYAFVVIGAIGIASCMDGKKFMELLLLVCGLSAVASIILLAVSPAAALMPEGSELRGLFSHKNSLGQVMAFGVIPCLYGLHARGWKRLCSGVLLVLFSVLALASQSATSCVAIFVFCGLDFIITLLKRGGAARFIGVSLIVFVGPIAVLGTVFPDTILELIGKDPTLTGRTELWAYVLDAIFQRPWLGWGYFAFWLPNNPVAIAITAAVGWNVPEAHNGLLELLISLGVVGTTLVIFLWTRNVRFALRGMNTAEKGLSTSALLCCVGIVFFGVSESVLMEPFQIMTCVFFITGFICEKAVRSARRVRYRPRHASGVLVRQSRV